VQDAAAGVGYPLSRNELLARLDGDDESVLVVSVMADDHFAVPDELEERLDDAFGMPSADPAVSMLDEPTAWRPD
jgi:hypothetical protein